MLVIWDDEYLYVAYWIEEPNLQASITERDGLIYQNNDVELFIAGQDTYYEFEINSYGTIYEVFFIALIVFYTFNTLLKYYLIIYFIVFIFIYLVSILYMYFINV